MNPDSLLDLAFGDSSVSNDHLPAPDYLPALAKQRELEALLAQQQVFFTPSSLIRLVIEFTL